MELLAAAGMGCFALIGGLVGVRLLALARRSGALPELLIGLTLLTLGPVGFPAATLGLRLQDAFPQFAAPLLGFGVAALALGGACSAWLTCKVFRADRRWARLLAVGLALALAASWAASAWKTGFDLRGRGLDVSGYGGQILRAFALAWTAGESLRYWRLMQRRLALGLTDPITTNRFLLWGVAAGTATLISLMVVFTTGGGGRVEIGDGTALVISGMGLVAAGSLWLAFLPPRPYLEWLRGRADAGQPAQGPASGVMREPEVG